MSHVMTTLHQWPTAWETLRAGPELDLLVAEHMGATWQPGVGAGANVLMMPGQSDILAERNGAGEIDVYHGLRRASRELPAAFVYAEWLNTIVLGFYSGGAEPWPRADYLTVHRCTERAWAATFVRAGEGWYEGDAADGVGRATHLPLAIVRAGLLCRRAVP